MSSRNEQALKNKINRLRQERNEALRKLEACEKSRTNKGG